MPQESGRGTNGRRLTARPAEGHGGGAVEQARRRRVLLVEDNRNLRLTTARMLEHLGYTVTAVDNGPAAVEAYRNDPRPDVAIVDLGLPGMDGREVLRSIRALLPGARVVLCSGAPEALAAGADEPVAVLAKPYDIESLSAVLARVLAA
jgi:CheY-like chemotaxis protein